LQSKLIVNEAINQKLRLAPGVYLHDHNNIWVKDLAVYDQGSTDLLLSKLLPKAFLQDKNWPLKILKQLDNSVKVAHRFVRSLRMTDWDQSSHKTKLRAFREYVQTLKEIQKYYAFAVPLTNYCEQVLKQNDEQLLRFAVQYKALDVDRMARSLNKIKACWKNGDKQKVEGLIRNHLTRFAWIKSSYNIVGVYTKEDIVQELASSQGIFKHQGVPKGKFAYLVKGLQAGIYLRNRVKEGSQQIWYAYDFLAKSMAKDLQVSCEDFLQLTEEEVFRSFQAQRAVITKQEIKRRHEGFVTGVLNGKPFVITGKNVERLSKLVDPKTKISTKEITGTTACLGWVQAKARVVHKLSQLDTLKKGEVLITSMTTPDFVVAMKKAGAIVTDEGGLSCHAAIVSRELGIPCVIGTKIATKVFKDGDLVEVDANNGTVRKI
jgi:phosphohistidine swiveling domain-containing protein